MGGRRDSKYHYAREARGKNFNTGSHAQPFGRSNSDLVQRVYTSIKHRSPPASGERRDSLQNISFMAS